MAQPPQLKFIWVMDKIYNIALADDHALILDGISTLIKDQPNLNIVYKARNGKELIDFVELSTPDICIIDMEMPILNGLQASELLLKKYPNLKIIILTMYQELSIMKNLINIGIHGYLLKTSDKDELLFAINQVIKGKTYFDGKLVNQNMASNEASNSSNTDISKVSRLSEREKEVATLLCNGLSNKQVAKKLFLSSSTVDNHRTNLMRKLDVHNVVELIRFCLRNGIAK